MSEDAQREVIGFLAGGRAFGVPPEGVLRIDTHAASVFLVGELAYKLKRAVRYSFLDFTTLARRRRALETELELNRATAPGIYRRLLPVTRAAGGRLALDGEGLVVEWLLEMARFDQAALLDRLAERGALDDRLVERLAEVVATFHAGAEPRPDKGGHAGIALVVEGNARDFAAIGPGDLEACEVEALDRATRARLERDRGLLERRREAGRVRLCHGDLHLGNIVRIDGEPVLFDRIEFDLDLACIDLLYDLAYLVMDLWRRDLRPQAQHLVDVYLEGGTEDDGMALMPLFLSLRAAIRAKVHGLALPMQPDAAHRQREAEEARGYLRLALTLLDPPPARLLAVGGLSGSGKTTLARRLAPELGAPPGAVVLRSDVIRKALFGLQPTARLPREAYAEEVSIRVYDRIAARAVTLLRAGRTVIADAVYADPRHRTQIEAAAQAAGMPFTGLWLDARPEILARRVAARAGDASDATVEVVRSQLRLDVARVPWPRLDAGSGIERLAEAARALLGMGGDSGRRPD